MPNNSDNSMKFIESNLNKLGEELADRLCSFGVRERDIL